MVLTVFPTKLTQGAVAAPNLGGVRVGWLDWGGDIKGETHVGVEEAVLVVGPVQGRQDGVVLPPDLWGGWGRNINILKTKTTEERKKNVRSR